MDVILGIIAFIVIAILAMFFIFWIINWFKSDLIPWLSKMFLIGLSWLFNIIKIILLIGLIAGFIYVMYLLIKKFYLHRCNIQNLRATLGSDRIPYHIEIKRLKESGKYEEAIKLYTNVEHKFASNIFNLRREWSQEILDSENRRIKRNIVELEQLIVRSLIEKADRQIADNQYRKALSSFYKATQQLEENIDKAKKEQDENRTIALNEFLSEVNGRIEQCKEKIGEEEAKGKLKSLVEEAKKSLNINSNIDLSSRYDAYISTIDRLLVGWEDTAILFNEEEAEKIEKEVVDCEEKMSQLILGSIKKYFEAGRYREILHLGRSWLTHLKSVRENIGKQNIILSLDKLKEEIKSWNERCCVELNKSDIDEIYSLAKSIYDKCLDKSLEEGGLLSEKEALKIAEGSVNTAIKVAIHGNLTDQEMKLRKLLEQMSNRRV